MGKLYRRGYQEANTDIEQVFLIISQFIVMFAFLFEENHFPPRLI